MAQHTIEITSDPLVKRGPLFSQFPIQNGDTVTFQAPSDMPTKVVFSSALVGRLDPQPETAVLQLAGGSR